MAKIKNIEDLRNFAIDTLDRLKNQEIDVNEALATGKLCDSVINTVKMQLEYHKILGEKSSIPFIEEAPHQRILEDKQKLID